jgi:hypothetical protein
MWTREADLLAILFWFTFAIVSIWHYHAFHSMWRAFLCGGLAGYGVMMGLFIQLIVVENRKREMKAEKSLLSFLLECAVCALIASLLMFTLILE